MEFIDNPKHQRSKLVRLTSKGDRRYRVLDTRFLAVASTLGANLGEQDIRRTGEILRHLSNEVKSVQSGRRQRDANI